MKSQMKAADRSGAALAVIVGSDEVAAGTAVVRPLRGGGEQVTVSRADVVARVKEMLGR
jgi:histidyl-tRNA synthetase